jgi:dolichyl-phosphate-mannose-protein mannosyltransferase
MAIPRLAETAASCNLPPVSGALPISFRKLPPPQRFALAIGLLSLLWALVVLLLGGIDTSILGLRVRSSNWSDPAFVSAFSLLVFEGLRRRARKPAAQSGSILVATGRWLRVPENLLLVAILVVSTVVRFWALTFGLPHPAARPDEEAVSSMAGSYFHGNIEQDIFTYPPLFMLAVAAALWLVFRKVPSILSRMNVRSGVSEPSTAAARTIARVLSAVSGVISVWLLFRIGARLFGRSTGLVAAACLGLAFLHVRDSHFGVTDVPMTCMVLVAFLAIVKLSQSGSHQDLVAAGIWTGLAVATKYNAALLALPACFAVLDDPARRPVRVRLGRAVLFCTIMTGAFLIVCPYSVINHQKFLADVMDVSRHLANGHGPDLGRGWTYHFTTTLRYGLGAPLLAAGVAGLLLMVWREGRRGVFVALFPVGYYMLMGTGRTVFARYALPVVPFLCLTAGYLIANMAAAAATYLLRPRWRVPATAVITAAVLWPSVLSVIAFDRLIARDDSRVLARRWIEARFPPGTTIAQLGQSNGHVYIDYEIDYALSNVTAAARPTLVIVVSSPLDSPSIASVAPWLEREYDLQFTQTVVAENDPANTYDRQDEFFVPYAGFHDVERPGPNLRIYVRRGSVASSQNVR